MKFQRIKFSYVIWWSVRFKWHTWIKINFKWPNKRKKEQSLNNWLFFKKHERTKIKIFTRYWWKILFFNSIIISFFINIVTYKCPNRSIQLSISRFIASAIFDWTWSFRWLFFIKKNIINPLINSIKLENIPFRSLRAQRF